MPPCTAPGSRDGRTAGPSRHAVRSRSHEAIGSNKVSRFSPERPPSCPPLPTGVKVDRLAIARWLVSPEHPLTAHEDGQPPVARTVRRGSRLKNGRGLRHVGTLPSHPELLDHLAFRFEREHSWSLKRMLRELALSATYRQEASVTPKKLAIESPRSATARGARELDSPRRWCVTSPDDLRPPGGENVRAARHAAAT